MKLPANLPGAPFDFVFDVGGNIGEFAEAALLAWPDAELASFEPLPGAAAAQRERAAKCADSATSTVRWTVYGSAVGEFADTLPLQFCVNQHSASTMQPPGPARREHFGIVDRFETLMVDVQPLDRFLALADGCERILVKIDVEGHELHVLRGARRTLDRASTVIVEVQNDPTIFLGSPSPWAVDYELRRHGLQFAGLAGAFSSPSGDALQFDGIWTRHFGPWREPPESPEQTAQTAS